MIIYDEDDTYKLDITDEGELNAVQTQDLIEQFVDEDYILESCSTKDLKVLSFLRVRFENRLHEKIPFYDIKAAIYSMTKVSDLPDKSMIDKISDFQITHTMRRLWRGGYIRRFVRNEYRYYRPGRGAWAGIHYMLYPIKKKV